VTASTTDDHPVAHQLDDAALMLREQRIDHPRPQVANGGERARLVLLDQPRVADDVRGHDCGEAAFDARRCHARSPTRYRASSRQSISYPIP
jgi:hypothetical protein